MLTKVVAVLESMWDWRGLTSGAGYRQAPRFFRINPENFTGRRLYKLVGSEADLTVTNSCRELVGGPNEHGTPYPAWLKDNLGLLDGQWDAPDEGIFGPQPPIDTLLVCGRIANGTYDLSGFKPRSAVVIRMPHPAARAVWTNEYLKNMQALVQLC